MLNVGDKQASADGSRHVSKSELKDLLKAFYGVRKATVLCVCCAL